MGLLKCQTVFLIGEPCTVRCRVFHSGARPGTLWCSARLENYAHAKDRFSISAQFLFCKGLNFDPDSTGEFDQMFRTAARIDIRMERQHQLCAAGQHPFVQAHPGRFLVLGVIGGNFRHSFDREVQFDCDHSRNRVGS